MGGVDFRKKHLHVIGLGFERLMLGQKRPDERQEKGATGG